MKKKGPKSDSISTFLGPDATVEGTLSFQGTIRLDGNFKGKIASSGGTVIVGEQAAVDADLTVGIAIVMGEMKGTIDASERIEIYPPGRIAGDIQSPVVAIEEGGVFNGHCVMTGRGESPKKPPPTLAKSTTETDSTNN